MSRKIVVAGNCQTAGITAILQRLLPNDQVLPLPLNSIELKGECVTPPQFLSADIVIGGRKASSFLSQVAGSASKKRFIGLPSIYFSAFHPDYIQVKMPSKSGVKCIAANSAICAWAFKSGIDPSDVVRIFNQKTFKALGYFSRWELSVSQMKSAFRSTQVDFNRFYLHIKRNSVFMHTVNHPKICVLEMLSKQICYEIDKDIKVLKKEVNVPDALGRNTIWPVYPDIANELAVHGSYDWHVERGTVIEGLVSYIDYTYQRYVKTGCPPKELQMMGVNKAGYDQVLSAALSRTL